MIDGDAEVTEHLMRLVPTDIAEQVYLEAHSSSWACAVGLYHEDLGPLPDGTPLSSAVTGRKVCHGWRSKADVRPGCAWEELSLLRMETGTTHPCDPFEEIDNQRLTVECASLMYRDL